MSRDGVTLGVLMKRNFSLLMALAIGATCSAADIYSNQSSNRHTPQLNPTSAAKHGEAAPAGGFFSECQNVTGDLTVANTSAGFSLYENVVGGQFRVADDFTVPAGCSWVVSKLKIFNYRTGFTTGTFLNNANFKIWLGAPNAGGTVVFSGTTTMTYSDQIPITATTTGNVYRIFNTVVAPTTGGALTAPGTTRRIHMVTMTPTTPITLPPGTYWVDYQVITPATTNTSFGPSTTHEGVRGVAGANALQFQTAGWVGPIADTGQPAGAGASVTQDMPFMLTGKWVCKPTEASVTSGEAFGGSVGDVSTSNNVYYSFFNDGSTLVGTAEFSSPAPITTPTSMQVVCEYNVARGGLALSLDEYDYSISDWVNLTGVEATTTDSVVDITVTSNVGNFASGGPLRARTMFSPVNDEDPSQDGWLHSVDQLCWTLDE